MPPDKPATVAAYAAGASLAAVTLFYVFGPNFTIDGDDSSSSGGRKKGIVGLSNPANDCFINSVLQALAGLGEFRVYLIRELHRREIEGSAVYDSLPALDDVPRGESPEKIRQLQQAHVTLALKEMLDKLNERPIYKKAISARPFVLALEHAFRTRISRNQQDAHEFLQVVVERLGDEFHAGMKARARSSALLAAHQVAAPGHPESLDRDAEKTLNQNHDKPNITVQPDEDAKSENSSSASNRKLRDIDDNDYAFPLEGRLESQVECQHCKFKYKPNTTSFFNLTLQVPQKSSTTLSSCFDGLLKTEHIEDFRCDKCQLEYALEQNNRATRRARSEKEQSTLQKQVSLIQQALETDPEAPPEGIIMPDPQQAPRRNIARHMRITVFPKIIAIHLSRSIFDQSSSTKNAAKVSFPERLPLGGILDRKWYKLLGIVCHKGSHQSGHYESFRRNHVYAPFSTPDAFRSYAQSRAGSENPSTMPSPRINPRQKPAAESTESVEPNLSGISPEQQSQSSSSASVSSASLPPSTASPRPHSRPTSRPASGKEDSRTSTPSANARHPPTSASSSSTKLHPPTTNTRPATATTATTTSADASPHQAPLVVPPAGSAATNAPPGTTSTKESNTDSPSIFRRKKQKPPAERWWRISDEKIKECKTNDVLGMQKEVYLLFYERERPGDHV